MGKKILIIEDEKQLARFVSLELEHEGYSVETRHDGRSGLEAAMTQEWDMILLDLMLPELDGFEVARRLRNEKQTPITIMTARDSTMDKVAGLDIGADDYITKPFSLMVLRARIEKVLKKQTSSTEYQDENYHFYFERMEFFFNDTPVELSKTEQKLLKILVFNRNQVVTREILIDRIWSNGAEFVDENALSVTVNRLRKKLDAGNRIQTVYGIGYTWRNE